MKTSLTGPTMLRCTTLLAALALSSCGDNLTEVADHGAYQPAAPAKLECVPNLDGQIDASELKAALGIPVSFLVSPAGRTRAWDVAGAIDGGGRRSWDWSVELAEDQIARLSASPLAGKWYAASFPGGQFVAAADAGGTLEGIYAQDANALSLLGIASASQSPPEGKTLLPYTAPVALYRFPLKPGAEWVSAGEVRNGTIRGLPYAGRDTYEVKVDAAGKLALPQLSFSQAHRVRTKVTISPAVGAPRSFRQVSFLFECFGEVARATSNDGETKDDFTTAAEVRRLGLTKEQP